MYVWELTLLKSQTDVNWEECSLAKNYGHLFGSSSGSQDRNAKVREIRNQERTSLKKKHQATKKNKESINRTLNDIDWSKQRNLSQVID